MNITIPEIEDSISEEIIYNVELEADIELQDDSYSDEYGPVNIPKYPQINSEITWDKTVYDTTANAIISSWLEKNKTKVEKIFYDQYQSD